MIRDLCEAERIDCLAAEFRGRIQRAFHIDLEAEDLGVNYQNSEKRMFKWCLRSSKDYDLAECEQFQTDEIQAWWDI